VELPGDEEPPEDEALPDEAGAPVPLSPHPFAQERSKPRTVAGSRCRIAYPPFGRQCSLRAGHASIRNNETVAGSAAAFLCNVAQAKCALHNGAPIVGERVVRGGSPGQLT
jgi:hypothetical protein